MVDDVKGRHGFQHRQMHHLAFAAIGAREKCHADVGGKLCPAIFVRDRHWRIPRFTIRLLDHASKAALALDDPEVRGAAVWTVARLGLISSLEAEIRGLTSDRSAVCLLIDGVIRETRIDDLARQGLGEEHSGQERDHGLAVQ